MVYDTRRDGFAAGNWTNSRKLVQLARMLALCAGIRAASRRTANRCSSDWIVILSLITASQRN